MQTSVIFSFVILLFFLVSLPTFLTLALSSPSSPSPHSSVQPTHSRLKKVFTSNTQPALQFTRSMMKTILWITSDYDFSTEMKLTMSNLSNVLNIIQFNNVYKELSSLTDSLAWAGSQLGPGRQTADCVIPSRSAGLVARGMTTATGTRGSLAGGSPRACILF